MGIHGLAARATKEEVAEPNSIFLDITGCDRVFDGFENLLRQVSDALRRLRISAHIAIAPTPGAAWALASSGKDGAIVEEYQLESALDPLPVESLRIGPDASAALRHLGLHAIGQVMHLPREVLPSRFGPRLLRRIDQAMGRVAEPLVPLEYCTPIEARIDWDGAVGSLEGIWSAFQTLITQIIEQLARRGQGARQIDFELLRLHSAPIKKTLFLSRPSRDAVNLFNLFRCSIEELQLPLRQRPRSRLRGKPPNAAPSPTRFQKIEDEGFSGMRITVPLCQRLIVEQIALLEHEQYAGQAELDRLIERLRVRMGNEIIDRVNLLENFTPEAAWGEAEEDAGREKGDAGTGRRGDAEKQRAERLSNASSSFPASPRLPVPASSSYPSLSASPRLRVSASSSRPLHLFSNPIEVRVMVTPSEDAEGDPAAFTHEGVVRRVMHCVGPERIAGRWWDGNDKTRDYFDIADPTGNRFWLFRVSQTGKWYLHGTFE